MIASSANRVPSQTSERTNAQIRRMTEANITYYARHREQIEQRLDELDQEWDIERTLEANAATLALAGTVFGTLFSRKWYIVPAIVSGFLLQHALQGWCPPLPVFRRLGVRTMREIDEERFALKALRGDFRELQESGDPAAALESMRAR